MTFRILLVAAVVLGLCNTGLSLDPKKTLRQYIHEAWNTGNGLPQNSVIAIYQSKDGYMWFATQEGVVRFDGSHFTIFDRTSTPEFAVNSIQRIMSAPDGTIYFAGQNYISLTRYQNGVFHGFGKTEGFDGKPSNTAGIDSTGAVWILSNHGVLRLESDRFVHYGRTDGLCSDSVYGIYADREHRVWFRCDLGLSVYENGKFVSYGAKDGVITDSIWSLYEDREGTMWIGTQHGINKFSNGVFTTLTKKDGLHNEVIQAMYEDTRHQFYFGSDRGVELYADGKFTVILNKDGSPGNSIARIFEDREGTIWVVPRAKGIQRVKNGALESFTKADGLSENDVRAAYEDNEGSLWIGTYGAGLDRLRDSKFITYSTEDGLAQNLIQSVFEDKDQNWWIGTFSSGLNLYKDGTVKTFNDKNGLPSNAIGPIAQDKSGAIWIGTTDAGIARYANGKFTTFTVKDGLVNNAANSMVIDKSGTLWIGSFSGITKYADGKFTVVHNDATDAVFAMCEGADGSIWSGGLAGLGHIVQGTYATVPMPDTLVGAGIFGLYQDIEGTLWIGTGGHGIIRYKDGKFVSISPRNGLFDYNSYCLLEDEFGNIWSDCNKGIYRVSKREMNDFCDGKIPAVTCTSYGTGDGMKNRECNGGVTPNAWKMHDGRLAFSAVGGLTTIYPADIKLNMVPPPVVIEQMLADQKPFDPKANNTFAPGTEKFQFTYAGISFLGGDKVKFKYKLEPFEKDWVDAGHRHEAFYTHIPPGEYSFKVIAANNDGVWNELGASTAFVLKPFFYQSTWFLAMCILGFVGVGPGIYLMRVRSLKQREIELTRIVEARTADLQKEKENVERALNDLKDAQHQLVLSEKMASLGQLTAGIAHEIKNPLNFVNNFSALSDELMVELQEEFDKKKDSFDERSRVNIEEIMSSLRQNVNKINEHGKRADSIVRGMLLHSRGKTGERQMTDLNALLAEYTSLAYHGMRAQDSSFNVKIETKFDDTIGQVNIVPQDLSRVFLNIINNGCYAANDKKKRAPNGFAPTISVSSKNLGNKFEVRIRDNGNGIPQSVIEKIFNPFFTTKPAGAGTGLGLSMSYDIVTQEHKGEIRVDTKEGEYAEFIITIPKM
ncbi:MAG TPA: two-component regulator propeller domain-containing protein [Bacteroidota bacterium]|nr:two-component regulator propeller domain-containing protein [Bacteroidota bacterium]